MDKILNKLGLYDIFGILLAGFVSLESFLLLCEHCYDLPFYLEESSITFWGLSFFLGVVLQELGHIIVSNTFNSNGRYIKQALNKALKKNKYFISSDCFTALESKTIIKMFEEKYKGNFKESELYENYKSPRDIYNYCRNHSIVEEKHKGTDREHATSAFARSISLSALILFFVNIIICINEPISIGTAFHIGFVSVCVVVLFYFRQKRLLTLRYVKTITAYYYSELYKEIENDKN